MLLDVRPDHLRIVQAILQKHVPQHVVWAFGSRAKWTAKEYSDLDLCVVTDKPLDFSVLGGMAEDFSDSDLPWKVDVVDWATTSESFRKIIERDKVVVQKPRVGRVSASVTRHVTDEAGKDLGMAGERSDKPLSELCSYINRGSAPAYIETGGVLVLNQKCVRDQRVGFLEARRTDQARKPVIADRMLQPLDILVNSTGVGTLGRVAQLAALPESATVDSHVTIVRPDPAAVDPRYLGFAIRLFEREIEELAEGSTGQTELSRARLAAFTVPVAPENEQRAIAHILGTLDDKIELNRLLSETLEAMARAIFKSWFVDFDPVRAKRDGRDPGLPKPLADLFPARLVDSELGEIPQGWVVRPLRDLTEYLSRGLGPVYIESGGVCVLNQKCIRDRRIDFAKARRHDQNKKSAGGCLLRRLDVLVNSTGVGTLGRVAQLWHLPEQAIVDSHVTVLRAAPGVDPWFFGTGLTDREAEIEALGEGSTGQTELSRVRLGNLACLAPPGALQRQFGLIAAQLLDRLSNGQQESNTLAALRDTLLPKLISGDLRVKDAERFVERAS
jgi:type I restriction enzyme S subunit